MKRIGVGLLESDCETQGVLQFFRAHRAGIFSPKLKIVTKFLEKNRGESILQGRAEFPETA